MTTLSTHTDRDGERTEIIEEGGDIFIQTGAADAMMPRDTICVPFGAFGIIAETFARLAATHSVAIGGLAKLIEVEKGE